MGTSIQDNSIHGGARKFKFVLHLGLVATLYAIATLLINERTLDSLKHARFFFKLKFPNYDEYVNRVSLI